MANTTAAIMAIPAPLENIRLVGDEEKHATLLYFGETSSLPDDAKNTLVESVKMACSMLFPFSERLREVARLGNDVPPALVAKLSDECLSQVRNLFKMNPTVNGYLSNTAQFPAFTPHVTLGHPDYTEEAILRTLAAQLYRVRFDRLAVWWNDERIEIPLSRIVEGDEMAMSDAVDEFMAHHGFHVEAEEADAEQSGTKGMKWGVRHIPATKEQARAHAAAQKEINNTGLKSLNASPKYAGKDLTKNAALRKAYHADAEKMFSAAYAQQLNHQSLRTQQKSKAKVDTAIGVLNATVRVTLQILAQAEAATEAFKVFELKLNRGVLGHIESVEDDTLEHSDVFRDFIHRFMRNEVLSHSEMMALIPPSDEDAKQAGVKGMRWGVRRRVDPKTGLVARTSSADQIHVDRIAKKLHNGGVSALSNKDLQEFSQRIQREQEFNRALASQEAQRSKPFIQRFLATQGKKQFNRVVDKAIDIAVEKALESAGVKIGSKGGKNAKRNTEIGNLLQETGVRLKPKKKGGGGNP